MYATISEQLDCIAQVSNTPWTSVEFCWRQRGTTLESRDCPVWCAALTSSRLPSQAPAATYPSLQVGGGPVALPPMVMGTKKSGMKLTRGRVPSSSLETPASRSAPASLGTWDPCSLGALGCLGRLGGNHSRPPAGSSNPSPDHLGLGPGPRAGLA